MTFSVTGAAASARAPYDASLQRPSSPTIASAVDGLGRATASPASDEAWDRIDTLLNQMRQLTLGAAVAAPATTTAQAVSAYSEHGAAADRPI